MMRSWDGCRDSRFVALSFTSWLARWKTNMRVIGFVLIIFPSTHGVFSRLPHTTRSADLHLSCRQYDCFVPCRVSLLSALFGGRSAHATSVSVSQRVQLYRVRCIALNMLLSAHTHIQWLDLLQRSPRRHLTVSESRPASRSIRLQMCHHCCLHFRRSWLRQEPLVVSGTRPRIRS